jgi:hypothetical protein
MSSSIKPSRDRVLVLVRKENPRPRQLLDRVGLLAIVIVAAALFGSGLGRFFLNFNGQCPTQVGGTSYAGERPKGY